MNATTVYAGLDVHATNTVIQSLDERGSSIGQQEIATRADQNARAIPPILGSSAQP